MKTNRLSALCSLSILLFAAACNQDQELLSPASSTDPFINKAVHQPDSTGEESMTAFKTMRLSWAPTDFKEVQYDSDSLPVRYTTQYQYVQGTDQVKRTTYSFLYSDKQQLTRLSSSDGSYVTYAYQNGQIRQTEEFASNGVRLAVLTYRYEVDGRLNTILLTRIFRNQRTEMEYQFSYNQQGNLTEKRELALKDGQFRLQSSTRFSDYDRKKNVENLWMIYPFLPGVTFSMNNPGLITQHDANGTEIKGGRRYQQYTYDKKMRPIGRIESGAGSQLKTTYTYTNW